MVRVGFSAKPWDSSITYTTYASVPQHAPVDLLLVWLTLRHVLQELLLLQLRLWCACVLELRLLRLGRVGLLLLLQLWCVLQLRLVRLGCVLRLGVLLRLWHVLRLWRVLLLRLWLWRVLLLQLWLLHV